MAFAGIAAGAACGLALQQLLAGLVEHAEPPDARVVLVAAAVLLSAAVIASAVPAARAARVDLIRALRAE